MEIALIGTVEYAWAAQVFGHLFCRHWGVVPVTWWGDREPKVRMPRNFTWRRVPAFEQGQWPWGSHFAAGLISVLGEMEGDVVAIFFPDHWLVRRVDLDAVAFLERTMREFGKVLRGNLTAATCLDGYGQPFERGGGVELVTVLPTDHHCSLGGGLTFCPSLWNREALMGLLEPSWSFWDCERVGTERFAQTLWKEGWINLGVRPGPVVRCHGLSRTAPRTANVAALSDEDRKLVWSLLPLGWETIPRLPGPRR